MTESDQQFARLFLVEDDLRLAQLTQEYLQIQGFTIQHEVRGDNAVERIINEQPDLVILDLMLPGLGGMKVCQKIRPQYRGPVLMLTAKDDDIDQILGLEVGADDYLVKPAQPRLLLARIHALLRRSIQSTKDSESLTVLNFGQLVINQNKRTATISDQSIELTTNEFELLWFLASHAGKIMSREQIIKAVRGIEYNGLDRWVDLHISRLRGKMHDNPDHPQRIKTIWGKGYLFVKDAWDLPC